MNMPNAREASLTIGTSASAHCGSTQRRIFRLCAAFSAFVALALPHEADAQSIVVSHDINTFASLVAGTQEATFAVNVATYLTTGDTTRNLLLFESNPGDGTRNFAPVILDALSNAGFNVTVTSDYSAPFSTYDAVFVAQDFPAVGFIDNAALIRYVSSGGSVYLAGGVGPSPGAEAAGWSSFLGNYGLAYLSSYNGLNSVAITSSHPIFSGVTTLGNGNGQSIIDFGTNANAQIVQFSGSQGVYAVVDASVTAIPEPATVLLFGSGLAALAVLRRRRPPSAD